MKKQRGNQKGNKTDEKEIDGSKGKGGIGYFQYPIGKRDAHGQGKDNSQEERKREEKHDVSSFFSLEAKIDDVFLVCLQQKLCCQGKKKKA